MSLSELHQFHFLRPQLLWLLLPAALLCWGLARTILNSGSLQKIIDPDLLPHLLLRGGEKRPWLFALIFALLAGSILALAGPTWRKLPTPVYSNQDALVILLDLSPSMMATDLSPDRLTRARLKILDILRERKDGLTALVAYGGEAHVVTPLTEDTVTIANLVPALSPSIVPVPGSNIEMAVEAGIKLLRDGANGSGDLLAVTDGIDESAQGAVKKRVSEAGVELSILAVGSGEGSPIPRGNGGGFATDSNGAIVIANFNAGELRKLGRDTGGRFAEITVDDSDIHYLLPEGETPQQAQLTEREFDQWREEGPWLVLLLLPFAALLFRRGALACALPLALLLPQHSEAQNLWRTPDQRGEELLEQGEPEQAAKTFKNPRWRGTANYRAGNFPAAAEDFAQSDDAREIYNLGNSLTQQGRYDEAIAAYDEALKQQPQMADARHNREIAEKLRELQKQQQQQQQSQQNQSDQQQQQQSGNSEQQQQNQSGQQQQSQQGSDSGSSGSQDAQEQQQAGQQPSGQQSEPGQQESEEQQQQSAKGENGEKQQQPQGEPQQAGAEESPLDPETQQALDQWLRQIPDDPAGLMREKFKYESLQRRRAYRSGEWQPPENGATQRW